MILLCAPTSEFSVTLWLVLTGEHSPCADIFRQALFQQSQAGINARLHGGDGTGENPGDLVDEKAVIHLQEDGLALLGGQLFQRPLDDQFQFQGENPAADESHFWEAGAVASARLGVLVARFFPAASIAAKLGKGLVMRD